MSPVERKPIPARTRFWSDLAPSFPGPEQSPIPGRFNSLHDCRIVEMCVYEESRKDPTRNRAGRVKFASGLWCAAFWCAIPMSND